MSDSQLRGPRSPIRQQREQSAFEDLQRLADLVFRETGTVVELTGELLDLQTGARFVSRFTGPLSPAIDVSIRLADEDGFTFRDALAVGTGALSGAASGALVGALGGNPATIIAGGFFGGLAGAGFIDNFEGFRDPLLPDPGGFSDIFDYGPGQSMYEVHHIDLSSPNGPPRSDDSGRSDESRSIGNLNDIINDPSTSATHFGNSSQYTHNLQTSSGLGPAVGTSVHRNLLTGQREAVSTLPLTQNYQRDYAGLNTDLAPGHHYDTDHLKPGYELQAVDRLMRELYGGNSPWGTAPDVLPSKPIEFVDYRNPPLNDQPRCSRPA